MSLSQSIDISLNTGYPMSAIKSIQCVAVEDAQEQVLCALSDGRIMQFNCDLDIAAKIRD